MSKKISKKVARAAEDATSFEDALEQLESIVRELEDGRVGLADALGRYEAGVKLLKSCYHLLEKAERRIELLSGVDADGNPVVAEFEDDAGESLDEKADARARRRSTGQVKRKRPTAAGDEPEGLF